MHVEISIASTDRDGRFFLTWTPVQATARLIDGPGAGQTVRVQLDLPGDGSPIRFWMAGEFQHPSVDFGDAVLEVVDAASSASLSSTPLMVRIRKDAQNLSAGERDRFLAAFGILNGQGTGRFTDFRNMHVGSTLGESHGNWGFLPWHRSYLLDLERELQNIDATVALPFWRFDQPAPKVFTPDFMGFPNSLDRVQFTAGHPFNQWTTEGKLGITRRMPFSPAVNPPGLKAEKPTIAYGGGVFGAFGKPFGQPNAGIEGDPHGFAHTCFHVGFIISPPIAPRDPLFFLLHANVDRLWAIWQWFYKRTQDTDPNVYYNGPTVAPGHNIGDTMWPWNGVINPPRPSTAPGGALVASALTSAPGPTPTVRSMIDYQAVNGGAHLGFDYEDVPFEMPAAATV
jgi:tyrosinase